MLNSAELLALPVQIVIVGEPENAAAAALRRAAYSVSLPNRVLTLLAPGRELSPDHSAQGKGLVDGCAAAYVCMGPVCSLPLTEPAALAEQLAALR